MKIHLITNLFHPDELAGAALYTDFADYFKTAGHEVRVTAAFSYYPAWKRRDEDLDVEWRDDVVRGIPVRRVSMYIPQKPNGITRLMSDATFFTSLLKRGTFEGWTPDVVVTACPMLSQCLAQRFLYRGKRVKKLIIVQDFVVDAALELGILTMPGLPLLLRALERWSLGSAHELTTISPEMLKKLQGVMHHSRPARYIPNWVHEDLDAEIRRQQESQSVTRDPLTLFYSGNLGIKQGLPDFLDSFSDVHGPWTLRIQGGGAEVDRIRERLPAIDSHVVLGPVEDVPTYVSRLRQCTACLVTQRAGVSANFLPSKLLPALATGTPVLAVAEATSPLAKELSQAGYGLVVPPDNYDALRGALQELADPAKVQTMSRLARERAHFFSRERVLGEFAEALGVA